MGSGFLNWIAAQADILTNIANTLGPVQKLITGGAYLLGLVFAFKAMMSLKQMGESRSMMSTHASMKEPLIYLIVAAALIYFPSALNVALMTTFGSSNILQYAPVSSSNQVINTIFGPGSLIGAPLTIIIQTIGLANFIRGWILIARGASGGQQQGGPGKGLIHIFGGILAINIVETVNIINNTIYGT